MSTEPTSAPEPLTDGMRGEHYPTTPVQCICGWRETEPYAGTWTSHLSADAAARARAEERERWDDAIDAIRFYRHGWKELRGVLASVADRVDEHTYDEFASILDDDWSDDGPVDEAAGEGR